MQEEHDFKLDPLGFMCWYLVEGLVRGCEVWEDIELSEALECM